MIPFFINTAQVYHLFRQFNRRTLLPENERTKDRFIMRKDRKGRNWNTNKPVTAEVFETTRPDFLNFSQFCECLGHIAIAAFASETAEERVATLWKWLDQSEGNSKVAKMKGPRGLIRFAVRGGY